MVVNPSYWVFEAFPMLKKLAPEFPWEELASSGAELIAGARFGTGQTAVRLGRDHGERPRARAGLPGRLRIQCHPHPALPAPGRGREQGPLLEPFERQAERGRAPAVIESNLRAGDRDHSPTRATACWTPRFACARGTPVPEDLLQFEPTPYYPSTLYLLALSYVIERQPQCL